MIQEHFFFIVDDQGCYSWILMFYDLGLKNWIRDPDWQHLSSCTLFK